MLSLFVRRHFHAAFGFVSNCSMPARNSKRIRVRTEAAVTTSVAMRKPKLDRCHAPVNSGPKIQSPAVDAVSIAYNEGNQILANRRAPRAPYFRTSGVSDKSGVFI